ncbi:P-loop containing nucleoside triphosphate hydrolase protein [Fomitiporia mediterranea MF3/22]|uniref:P-loop containing nucleoside triphosphate hydrolase protein n=1 Tax=Fomitiporia mediterranea (strain MF3/22) TaxID=694068 RepID=UPI00044084CF|nr:P-loop containing nucleoside triphosphate hydrolase protein [Fomitiporia mediterranea MF3/22]EJD03513.1 P-loop containing nucleoside triphosphate hydrolase protein [Fomitiporia mediterranea MF3/22]
MDEVFRRQFWALFVKNWIVLSKHPFLNLLRCFLMPIGYGIFLAVAQLFLTKPNNYGIGQPAVIGNLKDKIDGSLSLFWADGTNGTGTPSPQDIMSRVTSGFSNSQMQVVHQVATQADIVQACPQNFNLFSECFAAVSFDSFPSSSSSGNASATLNYTIFVDGGLFHIDVEKHTSDYEERVLPLQWAIDSAIMELQTGSTPSTPMEWPFTQETNKEQFTDIRLSYVRGLRALLVLALFVNFVGIAYQLPGSYMGERANLLTSHQQAMGLRDSARILSWYFSISLAYLPAWVIVALVWHFRIFSGTHVVIVLFVHLLLGFSLASWSFFVGAPFGNSPQLAAVATTFLAIVLAIIAQAFGRASNGAAFIFTLIFPPGYYVFVIRAIAGFESNQIPTNLLHQDPDNHLNVLSLMIAALIDIFIWPLLAVWLERRLYNAREPSRSSSSWLCCFKRRKSQAARDRPVPPPGVAISVRNLNKTYTSSWYSWSKQNVTAIADLTLDIPKFGIFVLLGSNGAGKSTALSILAGLQGRTSGEVIYEDGSSKPQHGVLGIVPQKNVLFPELTCLQTLKVWRAIKRPKGSKDDEDLMQLLKDCDLEHKIDSNAATLSGGQKRKLQLAVGLVGGSKIVLVDECTSGVDPLSRRSLWRTLMSVREDRTIVFTTHFLDESELIGDSVAILAAPGKLVAAGSPVSLKSNLGQGYTLQVSLATSDSPEKPDLGPKPEILETIQTLAPNASMISNTMSSAQYRLQTKDSAQVGQVLSLLESKKGALRIASYDVHGTSMEDIFLALMKEHGEGLYDDSTPMAGDAPILNRVDSKGSSLSASHAPKILRLTTGRRRSPFAQAFTIFRKRCMIARRSWLTPILSLIVAVGGSCIPLFFISSRTEMCSSHVRNDTGTNTTLFLPRSPLLIMSELLPPGSGGSLLTTPPNITQSLGLATASLPILNIQDNATFVSTINQDFRNFSLGGISVDLASGNSLFAWEGTPPGLTAPTLLNLVDNILYNALNTSGQGNGATRLITPRFETFPGLNGGTLVALKWDIFFLAAMSVFPAFYALYVSNERRSSVQAMQLSNGLADPVGLWLGHLMFDSIFSVAAATIIIIIFAAVASQLHGLGLFWVVLVLYGIVGTLFAYCVSLLTASPLAAFAAVAGYQIVMAVLYLAGYLLTFTYAKTSQAGNFITIIHFTLSILSPVASPIRASFVSVNLFSLLCNGNSSLSTESLGSMMKFGGPITYLIVYAFVLFAFLVWFDSGSKLYYTLSSALRRSGITRGDVPDGDIPRDVQEEASLVESSNDPLRVMHVSKQYPGSSVRSVDDVSFGVSRDTVLALLGPNGAGKTSTFNIIRGDTVPDQGDVLIQDTSVIRYPRTARLSLGVCPQFTAIDSQLTVREHLETYGRLKGLYRGPELNENVDIILESTGLSPYSDRLASKLSGGNQRKLSLAIALIGNPSVVLIDEFSTGIDAKMKRDMWETLKNVSIGKAVVITTHSMEEASALANKVGIIARKMLAVGSTSSLAARYPIYEIHFSCRTREEIVKAQELMARIPNSRKADDVATRFEVPLDAGNEQTLASLFRTLAEHGEFSEYTVERVSLESVFLKVIRENNIKEEGSAARTEKRHWFSSIC